MTSRDERTAILERHNDDYETIGINENWQHGDNPQSHPMWEEQLRLEEGMMRRGADRLRDQVVVASARGTMTDIAPVRGLMTDWVPGIAENIKEWCKVWDRKRGVKPAILPLMRTIDPYMAALVGIRQILNWIGHYQSDVPKNTVQNIAVEIGRTIEYELRVRAWANGSKDDKALWKAQQAQFRREKSTGVHQRRTNVNRFNHHLTDGTFEQVSWDDWTQDQIFRVGWEVMDAVVRQTGWFELIPDPNHVYRKGSKKGPRLLLVPKAGLTDWLTKALDHAEVSMPDYHPCVMPPRPWTDNKNGGYWTPYVKPRYLIRFKASTGSQKVLASDEYDAIDMPRVYAAVNALQDTAYRINRPVLDVFSKVWTELRWARDEAYLPELDERPLPPRTPRMMQHRETNRGKGRNDRSAPDEETAQEIFEWKRKASPVHAFNAKRAARAIGASATLRLATAFADYEAIYFPHTVDFRGRYYPMPSYLQPQGTDLARGLLTYATEAELTERGVWWLAVCLASNWGNDKWSFEERVKWVYENDAMLRQIAKDPYTNKEWFTADKPWQVLACIFEWNAYREANERGEKFYSSLPGMVDGTCNGIQHLSAIIRDEVAGEYVNLTPGEKPRDIYKFIADALQVELEAIEQAGGEHAQVAAWWLEFCGRDMPRSLTKRQVMVLPYGGTRQSFFDYTRAWLNKHDPAGDNLSDAEREARSSRVSLVVNLLWDIVKEKIKAASTVMTWLQDSARIACESNQPIFWTTPCGFVVRHFYGTMVSKRVDLFLDGQRCDVSLGERTADLSVQDQLRGIAPNFTHSLDASAFTDCVNLCLEDGIRAISGVHDAYGTHMANMDVLARNARLAFVMTHEVDVLANFREAVHEVMIPYLMHSKGTDVHEAYERLERALPPALSIGSLDLRGVLDSPYFFH
nr:DNA-directed RNA polymerase [uncultured Gellertiella sp.]